MALRDKIVIHLDGTVPVKDRDMQVEVRSPGGEVTMDRAGEFVEIAERTRKGNIRDWKRAHVDHVVYVRFIAGK